MKTMFVVLCSFVFLATLTEARMTSYSDNCFSLSFQDGIFILRVNFTFDELEPENSKYCVPTRSWCDYFTDEGDGWGQTSIQASLVRYDNIRGNRNIFYAVIQDKPSSYLDKGKTKYFSFTEYENSKFKLIVPQMWFDAEASDHPEWIGIGFMIFEDGFELISDPNISTATPTVPAENTPIPTEEPTPVPTVVGDPNYVCGLRGDFNEDGEVTPGDALCTMRFFLELTCD